MPLSNGPNFPTALPVEQSASFEDEKESQVLKGWRIGNAHPKERIGWATRASAKIGRLAYLRSVPVGSKATYGIGQVAGATGTSIRRDAPLATICTATPVATTPLSFRIRCSSFPLSTKVAPLAVPGPYTSGLQSA